jgi:ELWxxDGT repeat protein
VADLNPAYPDAGAPANLDGAIAWASLGDRALFFAGTNGPSPASLLVTDGTAARTTQLAEVNPPVAGELPPAPLSTADLAFFFSREGLWRTDGTPAGTFLFALTTLNHYGAALLGREIAFTRCSSCGLSLSDGTVAGTRMLAVPALVGTGPRFYQSLGGRVYFAVLDAAGASVWITDGTVGGTRELWSGPHVRGMATAVGRVVFTTLDQTSGTSDVWSVEDGAPAARLAIFEGSISPLVGAAGHVYWNAFDPLVGGELWRTDGTAAGTHAVSNVPDPDDLDCTTCVPGGLAVAGGKVFFAAKDAGGTGRLWVSTGTAQSSHAVAAGCGGPCPILGNGRLVAVGARVLFLDGDDGDGALWSSDGTATGTRRLTEVSPSVERHGLQAVDGRALFAQASGSGEEIWISDGTLAGTRRLIELPGVSFDGFGWSVFTAVAAQHRIFFAAPAPDGARIYVSDGTPGGTQAVSVLGRQGAQSNTSPVAAAGATAIFSACRAGERSLWRTEGIAGSTVPLSEVFETGDCVRGFNNRPASAIVIGDRTVVPSSGQGSTRTLWGASLAGGDAEPLFEGNLRGLGIAGTRVVFLAGLEDGTSLRSTDGTAIGTSEVTQLPFYSFGFHSLDPTRLLFANDVGAGVELWITDGTAHGTTALGVLTDSLHSVVPAGGGSAYLFTHEASTAPELWTTDGTPAGTIKLRTFTLVGSASRFPAAMLGGQLFFLMPEGFHGISLWRSDGTPSGTQPVAALPNLRSSVDLIEGEMAAVGDLLYFRHCDVAHACELWRSDGTVGGTAMVADILPGPWNAAPAALTPFAGRLVFTAYADGKGVELWTTDGTAAGTRLVADIAPGPQWSSPRDLRVVGDRLYFAADDGLHGEELWSLPASGLAGCQASTAALCLNGGRFEVTAFWRDFEGRNGEGRAEGLTGDTGYFWFFDPANVEATLKVLDGRGLNDHFWVFYGALSSVEYALTVRDTATGASRRYYNPSGALASVGDTSGFGPRGALAAARTPGGPVSSPPATGGIGSQGSKVACAASATTLCLNGGRFAVVAAWRDFAGRTGIGTAVPLTADTGYFWFFDSANVEVMLKVLDGRAVNGKFWVFFGALSNVEYTLTVTDTLTGAVRSYPNASGRFASVADTAAF